MGPGLLKRLSHLVSIVIYYLQIRGCGGLNLHQMASNLKANEAGTIIIDPHNGATIKGKSHRKISTGKKENYILTPHFLLFQEEERLNSFVIQSYHIILVSARGVFKKSTKFLRFHLETC